MFEFFWWILAALRYSSTEDNKLVKSIRTIIGFTPRNLSLYHLAMKHSSMAVTNKRGFRESNERLEYLGDAVLGLVVAELLFARYPYKDEGFLTEMRSKIVNRESLNRLGKKIGLQNIIVYNEAAKSNISHKSLYGDTMEALIGAVYLDLGYKACKSFVIRRLINHHFDLEKLIHDNPNYKSKIIEWAQKNDRLLDFEVKELETSGKFKQFEAQIVVDGEVQETGYGLSKKKAEQDAARKTCEKNNI